jgi:hypothetical protein
MGDAECVATENCDGTRPAPRVVVNPARYCVFKEMFASAAADQEPGSTVLVCVGVVNGPAQARKEVEKQKIAGNIACYRGPVWREQYGVQEVFGIVK